MKRGSALPKHDRSRAQTTFEYVLLIAFGLVVLVAVILLLNAVSSSQQAQSAQDASAIASVFAK